MAISLLYLGLYLGPYSILVTAGSGGVYIYSYYSYCRDYCGGSCYKGYFGAYYKAYYGACYKAYYGA